MLLLGEVFSPDPTVRGPGKRAARARKVVSELGPAFVKIGQALSARPDLFTEEVLEELRLLQDDIPPFDSNLAMRVIEKEMNAPLSKVFSELTAEPVAAASIGQVYRGRLLHEGVEVAVKVQRPGMRAAISLDIFLLRYLATQAMKVVKTNTDLPAIIDEWAASLYKELNYQEEADNGERFREQLEQMKEVLIPRTFSHLTTQHVLILEWVDGLKLSEVKGETSKQLVEIGVYCSLAQLLDRGFYHADPHPGNLLMTLDGKLAYLDFGMMGELQADLRYGMVSALVHLVNQEYEELADDFVELGMLPGGVDAGVIVPALTQNLKVFMNDSDSTLSDVSFATLFTSLSDTMYKYKFRIPSYYTLIIRSLAVLEGIALESDPNFKVLRSAYPWVARRLLSDPDPAIQKTLISVLYKDGAFQYRRLETLIEQAGKQKPSDLPEKAAAAAKAGGGAANDMRKYLTSGRNAPESGSVAGMFSSVAPSSAIAARQTRAEDALMLANALSFVLSERGDFLLDVLLTEIAKGLESIGRVQVLSALQQRLQPVGAEFWVLGDLLPGESRVEEDMQRAASITSLVSNLATGVLGVSSTAPNPPASSWPQVTSARAAEKFTDRFRNPDRAGLLQAARVSSRDKPAQGNPEMQAPPTTDTLQLMRDVIEYLSPETQQKAMQLPARLLEKFTTRATSSVSVR